MTAPITRVQVLPHPELCAEGLSFEARHGRKLDRKSTRLNSSHT